MEKGRDGQPSPLIAEDCWPARLSNILAEQQDRLRLVWLADNAYLPQRSTRMRRIINAEMAIVLQDYEGTWSELASAFGSQFIHELRTATEESSCAKNCNP